MYKNNKRIAKLYPSLQFRPAVKAACRDLESNHGTDTFTRTFIPIYLKSHETIPRGRDIECIASMGTSIEDMLARSNQQDLVDLRETSLLRRVLCSNLLAGKLPTLSLSLFLLFHSSFFSILSSNHWTTVRFSARAVLKQRLHRSCDGLLACKQLRAGNEAQSRV